MLLPLYLSQVKISKTLIKPCKSIKSEIPMYDIGLHFQKCTSVRIPLNKDPKIQNSQFLPILHGTKYSLKTGALPID